MEETEIIETENVKNDIFDQVKALVDELQLTIESLEDANRGMELSYLINNERIDNNEIFDIKEKLIDYKVYLEDKILKLYV